MIQQSGAPLERLTSLVWFTYDLDGSALWLVGHAIEDDGRVEMVLHRTGGTRFGDRFDAAAVTSQPFGRLILEFDDCEHARLQFDADDPRYGAFTRALVRLTRPDVANAACVAP